MPAMDVFGFSDPPLAAWLHLPTKENPLRLHRTWTPEGASVWTDDGGRRWWAVRTTVPQYCAWCRACITRGWACKSVGIICDFHCRQIHPTESGGSDGDGPGDLPDGADGGSAPGPAGGGGGDDPPRPVRCPVCGSPLLPSGECPYKFFWHGGEWDDAHKASIRDVPEGQSHESG